MPRTTASEAETVGIVIYFTSSEEHDPVDLCSSCYHTFGCVIENDHPEYNGMQRGCFSCGRGLIQERDN